MAEPMDPREVMVRIAEDLVETLIPGPRVTMTDLLSLAAVAFARGAASMEHEPAWTNAILRAFDEDGAARDTRGPSDAAMAHDQACQWPIAVPSR